MQLAREARAATLGHFPMLRFPHEDTLVTVLGRKYVTEDECWRVLAAARICPDTCIDPLAATLVYTGCHISEALAACLADIDLEHRGQSDSGRSSAAPKHWREVPRPAAHVRELELVYEFRVRQQTREAIKRLWPIGWSTASRYVAALMASADIAAPRRRPKGFDTATRSRLSRPTSPSRPSSTSSATPM